jgi:hypothetical protein
VKFRVYRYSVVDELPAGRMLSGKARAAVGNRSHGDDAIDPIPARRA